MSYAAIRNKLNTPLKFQIVYRICDAEWKWLCSKRVKMCVCVFYFNSLHFDSSNIEVVSVNGNIVRCENAFGG